MSAPLLPKTSAYGEAFEHLVITEAIRLASYFFSEYRFSFVHTKDGAEIDLVVERPGQPLLCIEIKSANHVLAEDVAPLARLCQDLPRSEAVCLCNEPVAKRYENVRVLPWQDGLREFFMPA